MIFPQKITDFTQKSIRFAQKFLMCAGIYVSVSPGRPLISTVSHETLQKDNTPALTDFPQKIIDFAQKFTSITQKYKWFTQKFQLLVSMSQRARYVY